MADDATTLNYVDDATTVTVSDDSTVVESAAAGAPGVGVPSGGTTGQALVKNSNADYDTHWSTPSTVAALDDLTDVTAPTPANGDGLVWNGTAWVNVDVATQAELNAHTGATGTAVHGLGTASTHNVPASGNASSSQVVKGDDTRLTDNRTDPTKVAKAGDTMTGPLVGSANGAQNLAHLKLTPTNTSTAEVSVDDGSNGAYAKLSISEQSPKVEVFDATNTADLTGTDLTFNGVSVVKTNDSRLSDARTPTAHASSHAPGGTDALPWTTIHGYGTAASRPAAASTNAGYIYLATDTGTLSRSNGASWDDLLKAGTGATNYTAGNDSRLSDTRTPTDGTVTDAKVSASAAIALSKLASQADKTFVGNVSGGSAVPTAVTAANVLSALSGAAGADFAWNSHKLTGITAGTATGHAATYEQTAVATLTTQGDTLYASAANTPARLAIGTAYQVLRTNSGATAPEWVSGGMQLIAETVLVGTSASIDFTSIPATFRHLRVEFVARSDRAGTPNDFIAVALNNDTTGTNYIRDWDVNGSFASNGDNAIAHLPGATAIASRFVSGTIEIPYYAKTTAHKGMTALAHRGDNEALSIYGVTWKNTAAVNRVTFTSLAGANFIAGSCFALYGIG